MYACNRKLRAFEQLVEDEEDSANLSGRGDEDSGFFSGLFFCWVNPLILSGRF